MSLTKRALHKADEEVIKAFDNPQYNKQAISEYLTLRNINQEKKQTLLWQNVLTQISRRA